MSKKPLLLVGAGGHARSCIDVIERHGEFMIAGLVGVVAEVGTRVLGYPVLGTDANLESLRSHADHALLAVGQIKSPDVRIALFEALAAGGWSLPAIVSPLAHVSRHAQVGDGTIVMHGAIVNAAATVGRNCILNSLSLVEHDVDIADHCHVATAATVNSGVWVGQGTFIGSNSSLRQGITIGERCVVGMGQHVLADCPAGSQLPPRSVK